MYLFKIILLPLCLFFSLYVKTFLYIFLAPFGLLHFTRVILFSICYSIVLHVTYSHANTTIPICLPSQIWISDI